MSDQVFDVVQYGATGNGVADDYPAISAAYDALVAAGGGELWFPPGRRYRVRSTGVHGLHLVRQGNVTIRMGERAVPVMDNMVDGLAVSHGIFVEGPAANIALIGVQVRYATLSAARQGWAPIYFLGANVGSGDGSARPYGWYRGNPDGTEAWPRIEAGAVRNVRLENNIVTAALIAERIGGGGASHGFGVRAARNSRFLEVSPGKGASANGWPVAMRPTGSVAAYDVKPMSGGRDPPAPAAAGAPYDIVAAAPGVPFDATFEYAIDGWKLVSLVPARTTYPNGVPLIDAAGRLHDQAGTAIADALGNRTYANGAVLGFDSGMLAMGPSAPPSSSTSLGVAGMLTYDANHLYVCIAANT